MVLRAVRATRRKFRSKYGIKSLPSETSIRRWYNTFKNSGYVLSNEKQQRKKAYQEDEVIDTLAQLYKDNPMTSIRNAAQHVPVGKTTVNKIVKKYLNLYPYKIQMVQALQPPDYEKRAQFAATLLERSDRDGGYLNRVLFTDEATFHVSGRVNRHNVRIWGTDNPGVHRELERDSPKVHVWCGIFHDRVIGPFFFSQPTINQENFLDMLEQFVYPQLNTIQHDIIFQLDGAPPHWGLDVRASLNAHFPDRWIGRSGPTPWPPRSPDLTPLDFFLWGYVKTQVYKTPVHNLEILKTRITLAVASITRDMLTNTWRSLKQRLQQLVKNGGQHVEVV